MRFGILILLLITGCTPPGKPVQPAANAENSFDKLYAANCAGCHGADGKYGSAPILNEPIFLNEISLEPGRTQVIASGRAGTAMPAFDSKYGGPLTSSQVAIIANGLNPKWAPSAHSGVKLGFYGSNPPHDAKNRGPAIYAQYCAQCHGADGRGGAFEGRTIGALNDQSYLALTSNQYLWRVSVLGRRDLGCPDYSGLNTVRMNDSDANDLTAYLASWRKKP